MAFVLEDRVRETSTSTGTGSFTLDGTVSGFQTFDAVMDTGDTTWYCIVNGAEWEVGLGTFTSPGTLARTTVLASSNGGSAVNFAAGTKDVFVTIPGSAAEALQSLGALGTAAYVNTGTSSGNVPVLDGSGKLVSGVMPATVAPLASPTFTGTPAAPTATAGTNTTQIATTAYVVAEITARIASLDVMVYKGLIDCSANPNYPAASAGDTYRVSVAGKIGGGSGPNVEAGDILICGTDSSASGNHATVGSNWGIIQVNIDGAVTLTGTQTLTNKTLTSPVINTPTGIVKADVGLGNVANVDTTNADNISSGTLGGARGGAVGEHAIYIDARGMKKRTTGGPADDALETSTNKVMLDGLGFDATSIEYAQVRWRMPKAWNAGTVTFQPVWRHLSTTTNFGVSWGLQAVALSDDDAGDAAFGTAQFSNDTGGTTADIYVGPESSAITIAGSPAAEDFVVFQVFRKADDGTNDTLAVDAVLLGIVVFITTTSGNDT